MKALSPKSIASYEKALARAFPSGDISSRGLDAALIETWGNSARNQLKCAVRWHRKTHGQPPKDATLEDLMQPKYVVEKQVYTPSEFEMENLEKAADAMPPHHRACVLLLLYLGLRAEEFYALKRQQVERALATGTLVFVRKGGREDGIDVSRVVSLWQALLNVPAKASGGRHKRWETVGHVFSEGVPESQYHVIRRVVRKAFKLAGLPEMSPHKLRHAFATRMVRDGASMPIIQRALNHKNIATTALYTHASTADVAKFMRGTK